MFNTGLLASSGAFGNSPAVAGDFNGDGKLDLAIGYLGGNIGFSLLIGNGNGTFQPPVQYAGTGQGGITAGDVNGDGFLDIVVSGITIYLNNGRGEFTAAQPIALPGFQVAIGDVNGDNIADLVSSEGYVALGLGQGRFGPATYYPVESSINYLSVALADLRGGGLIDIVIGLIDSTSVLLNNGAGKFEDGRWTTLPGAGNCAATGDFNGDGKPDLAVPTTNGLVILLGTGNAASPYAVEATIGLSGPGCPISGDLNGDGIADLIEGADSLGGTGIYLGNGDGTFKLPP